MMLPHHPTSNIGASSAERTLSNRSLEKKKKERGRVKQRFSQTEEEEAVSNGLQTEFAQAMGRVLDSSSIEAGEERSRAEQRGVESMAPSKTASRKISPSKKRNFWKAFRLFHFFSFFACTLEAFDSAP
jgi:hypothetical protein